MNLLTFLNSFLTTEGNNFFTNKNISHPRKGFMKQEQAKRREYPILFGNRATPFIIQTFIKELSLYHKFSCCKTYIFAALWSKPLIFQTYIIWSNIIHSLKYLRSSTLGCNDIEIRKSEFVAKTQFLCKFSFFLSNLSLILKLAKLTDRNG